MWRWSATPIISPGWETTVWAAARAERAGLNFPTGPARPLRPWWTKRWRGARKCSSSWRTAVMERYACPRRDYYTWCAGNAAGFILDAARWQTHGLLDLAGEACYAEEA